MPLFDGKKDILRPKKFTRLRRAALFFAHASVDGVLPWSDPILHLYDHHEKAQQKAHDQAYEQGYEAGKKSQ